MALNFTPYLYIPRINNIESTIYISLWCVLCTLGNTITGKLLKMDFPGLPYSMKSLYFHLFFIHGGTTFVPKQRLSHHGSQWTKNMGKSQSNTDLKKSVLMYVGRFPVYDNTVPVLEV